MDEEGAARGEGPGQGLEGGGAGEGEGRGGRHGSLSLPPRSELSPRCRRLLSGRDRKSVV